MVGKRKGSLAMSGLRLPRLSQPCSKAPERIVMFQSQTDYV